MRKLILVFGAASLLIMACRFKPSEPGTGKIRVFRDLEYVPGGHMGATSSVYICPGKLVGQARGLRHCR